MYNPMHRPPRPRLTGPIIGYALLDVFGLSCVALGASWFASGKGVIIASFPTSTVEAVASLGGGVAVMLWAVSRILRELARQQPEMQARYAEWMAKHHPDKVASLRPTDDKPNDRADR